MLLPDLVDQYTNTQDPDLRYMALREHVLGAREPWDPEHLRTLVSRVLLPALSDNDSAIGELVSTQIFTKVAQLHPADAETCIVLPLCQQLQASTAWHEDGPHVLQSLRNVLPALETPLCGSEALQLFFESLESTRERPYMAWDALGQLLRESPDDHVVSNLYPRLYFLALQDGRSAAMSAVRVATTRVSAKVAVETISQAGELTEGHVKLLSHITEEHAAFRFCYEQLIESLLQHMLTDPVCSTLENLSIWLRQPSMGPNCSRKTSLASSILEKCHQVLLEASRSESAPVSEDEDMDQEAYLRELSDNEEAPEFDDEDDDDDDDDDTVLVNLCLRLLRANPLPISKEIEDLLRSSNVSRLVLLELLCYKKTGSFTAFTDVPHALDHSPLDSMPLEVLADLPSTPGVQQRLEFLTGGSALPAAASLADACTVVKDAAFINAATRSCICKVITNILASESPELSQLQMAIDALSTAAKRPEFNGLHDSMAELVWPYLKPNKCFIRTIKVGNMKQSIDDGIALRLNCYTLLHQLELTYSYQCKTLEECVERGLKDEHSIKEAATELYSELLELAWPQIRIRDATWFMEKLCPRIQDRIQKHSAYQPASTATSQQIADWTKGLNCLEHVGLVTGDKVMVINNDFDGTPTDRIL